MALKETYKIEKEKWDELAVVKAARSGIHQLQPGDNFVAFSNHSNTHIGIVDFLGDLKGRRVLEPGCGTGQMAVRLAMCGAIVTAFDLSPASIDVARQRVDVNGLQGLVRLFVSSGEHLPIAENSFDLIFGKAILHHLNPGLCRIEFFRVLKVGGKAAFVEPMGMNPLLNFARNHLPYPNKNPRGADRPLNYDEIKTWGELYGWFKYREIQLTSMIDRGFGFGKHMKFLTKLDNILLDRFPFLRRFCRYVVLYMVK